MTNDVTNETRSVFAAVVGRANVGKSSLINRIVGQKIAIVSDKPQTTRTRIMGVHTVGADQLVFIDTPGFHKPKNKLGEKMMESVSSGLSGIEAAVLVVDAAPKFKVDENNIPAAEQSLLEKLSERGLRVILAVNKTDLLTDKTELLSIIKTYSSVFDFEAVVPLSAVTGEGVDVLVSELLKFAKPSPHFFADDDVTDQADSAVTAELIREKLLLSLDKEIPHGIAVGLERFFERDSVKGEPIIEVDAVIYCEKESHKGIIIGKQGAMLKKVGSLARADIEEFFGCKCNLKLWVKVKEGWRNREGLIRSFGLDRKD